MTPPIEVQVRTFCKACNGTGKPDNALTCAYCTGGYRYAWVALAFLSEYGEEE
jgi:DnaJ-class molecular chaperone